MDFLHTDNIQPSENEYSAATAAKSDAPDGMLSSIVRLGVAGVYGASSAILDQCLGGGGNVLPDCAGPANGRGEPDTVKQPKYKRQLGCPGAAASIQLTKSEKAGEG